MEDGSFYGRQFGQVLDPNSGQVLDPNIPEHTKKELLNEWVSSIFYYSPQLNIPAYEGFALAIR